MCGCSRGACVVAQGGMCGCSRGWGIWGVCKVAPRGACMVAPRGHAWLLWGMHGCFGGMCGCSGGHAWLLGGHAWLLRGHAWLLRGHAWLPGGHVWLLPGGCVLGCSGGRPVWDTTTHGDTVNERAVRILLECILVLI